MWFHHEDHQRKLKELDQRIRELFREILGEQIMSQVQFTLSLTVNPASVPLAESLSSGSAAFTVGTPNSVILAAITGGVAPYTPSVDPASASQLPPGLALSMDPDNNLIVSGTATVAGTGAVLIDVVDSQGTSVANVKAKL
jgi:hypothetical protein